MKVWVCSGYPLSTPKGNSVTAVRIAKELQNVGIDAQATDTSTPEPADHLIALNAIMTANAILHFHQHSSQAQIHVMLTGTDVHREIHLQKKLATQIFETATSLVVAHPECIHEIPENFHHKVRVIYPSVSLPQIPDIPQKNKPLFTCLGHLRHVKNPHLLFKASQLVEEGHEALSLGDALDQEDATIATQNADTSKHYRWISNLDRAQALGYMKQSLATINTSFLEGGANTILEAITLNVPVLASNVDGNRGLLGEDYKGLFPSDDAEALAGMMRRCITDPAFLQTLSHQLTLRKPLFSPEKETKAWLTLLKG